MCVWNHCLLTTVAHSISLDWPLPEALAVEPLQWLAWASLFGMDNNLLRRMECVARLAAAKKIFSVSPGMLAAAGFENRLLEFIAYPDIVNSDAVRFSKGSRLVGFLWCIIYFDGPFHLLNFIRRPHTCN